MDLTTFSDQNSFIETLNEITFTLTAAEGGEGSFFMVNFKVNIILSDSGWCCSLHI